MKEKICVNIGKNHFYSCTTNTIGRNGENECTEFELTLSEELKDNWLYLDFKKPDGSTFKTPRLEVKDNKAYYEVPYTLLDQKGELSVQVVLQNEDGVIWKSSVKTYYVKESINATEDIENKEDFITEAQSLLDDMTETFNDLENYTETKKQELNTELTNVANTHIININDTGSKNVKDIDNAKTSALSSISAAETNAVNDITTLKNTSISEMETKQDELIAELNNEQTLARIAELEKENAEQQKELDVLYGDFKENTVSGESAVISDGLAKSKIKSKIKGNTKQETTEGYNLYNYVEKLQTNPSGLTVEYDEKTGYITINGTPTKAYTGVCSAMNITDILEDGETYTLKQEQYASANGGAYVQIVATDLTGKDNHLVASSASRQIKIDKSNYIRYSIMVQTGPSLDAFNNYRNRYWLYKGTDDKPFEIFTNGVATPNPNHKQDIEVITEASLVHRGKNILNIPDVAETTKGGITYSVTNGKFKANGTATTGFAISFSKKFVFKKGIYTHSVNKSKTGVYFSLDNSNDNMLGANNVKTINLTEDTTYSFYQIWINAGVTFNDEEYEPMIEDGTVKTEFEPYIEPKTIPINLAGNKLAKVTNEDLLKIYVNGKVQIKNKVTKEYILTGEESNLIENYVTKGLFQITLDNVSKDLTSVCAKSNYLKGEIGYIVSNPETENYLVSTYSGNRIFFRIDDFANNIEGFKAWLKEKYNEGNPLKVTYELETSETIDLPSIEPIELFEGTNIFELVTNLDTTMSVTYKVSNKNKILSLEERISALESAVIGG